MGELSRATGVPVATLKYYVREGLLHAGRATAVNQAEYDDSHVRRVRLVRALLQMGHLSIADAQRVVAAAEDETVPLHDAFGLAQDGMVPERDRSGPRYAAARTEADRFVARHKLRVRPEARVRDMLADALVAMADFLSLPPGELVPCTVLDSLVAPLVAMADQEVGSVPVDVDRATTVEHTVVGTVAFEVGYAAVRRMALEHASATRFGRRRR